MTKSEFNKISRYLTTKINHKEFVLRADGTVYKHNATGSDADFIEISVDTLFNIVGDILIKQDQELKTLKSALSQVEFSFVNKLEHGWAVEGFVPNALGKYIDVLK